MLSGKSQFLKSVFTLMSGTTIAQAIPILISPLLTRLYSPTDFAGLAIFVLLTTLLGLFGTGRYELAIMLPKDEAEVASIATLTVGLLLFACLIYFGIFFFFHTQIASLLHYQFNYSIYWLPLTALFYGLYQIFSYLVSRKRQYYKLARSVVIQQITAACVMVGLGFLHRRDGLVIGQMMGQIAGCIVLSSQVIGKVQAIRATTLSHIHIIKSAKQYRQFPFFNVPYSLIGTLSQDFIVLALTIFNQVYIAGLYSLARRVLYAPINFLSATLGQVFYKEAVVEFGHPNLESLTTKISLTVIALFVPALVFFVFWAPDLFAWVFGEKWRAAGSYAVILTPMVFLFLFTSWPERIYEVAKKQHISLLIQVSLNSVAILTVMTMLYFSIPAIYCVIAFVVIDCCYHIIYLTTIYYIADFKRARLLEIAKKTLMLAVGFSCLLAVINLLNFIDFIKLFMGLALLSIYYIYWFLKQNHRSSLVKF